MSGSRATTHGNEELDRHHQALRRVLALIFVYVGLADDTGAASRMSDGAARAFRAMADPGTLSRRVHRMVLRLLLPAEAATRRLIVALAASLPTPALGPSEIARRGPVIATRPTRLPFTWTRGVMVPPAIFTGRPAPATKPPVRHPRFSLVEPLKRSIRRRWVRQTSVPHVAFPGAADRGVIPVPAVPSPHDRLPDRHVLRRVAALARALDDLSRQAHRFARWRAFRDLRKTNRTSPLRPGRPPGSPPRRSPPAAQGEVHGVLADMHRLAIDAHDTS